MKVVKASVAQPLSDGSQREMCGDGGGFQGQLVSRFLAIVQQVIGQLGYSFARWSKRVLASEDSAQCERDRTENRKIHRPVTVVETCNNL